MAFWILILLALALIWLLFYYGWFLRNPKVKMPKGNVLTSPADGKIIKIIEIKGKKAKAVDHKKGLLGSVKTLVSDTITNGYVIVIMMNPMDMHFQKSPFDAQVFMTKHTKGKLRNAMVKPLFATFENEKNEILLKTKIGKIKIVQVAGIFARRIHCFVKKNQKIKKGQDLGVIKLGSQVLVVVPKVKLIVNEGVKVKAGKTVLARL